MHLLEQERVCLLKLTQVHMERRVITITFFKLSLITGKIIKLGLMGIHECLNSLQCGEQKVIGGKKHHSVSTTISVLIIIIDNIVAIYFCQVVILGASYTLLLLAFSHRFYALVNILQIPILGN